MQSPTEPQQVIADFMSPDDCATILEHLLPHRMPIPGSLSDHFIETVDLSKIPTPIYNQLLEVVPFTKRLIKQTFKTNTPLIHKGGSVLVMPEGSWNPLHVDNDQSYPDTEPESEIIDAPTANNKRHFSAVFMLNDDYEGGTLEFPDQDKKYRLKPGQVIVFKGDSDTVHGVAKVTKGLRINFAMFFTEDI
jgi:2OG-Fe(II) oxygenase superfamily